VAPVGTFVGLHYDTVFVVGLTEGTFPPPARDDAVLPDAARASLGPDVAIDRAGDRAVRERIEYVALLAAADEIVLTFPRADTRAQREVRPARWVLDAAADAAGRSVGAGEMLPSRAGGLAPWLRVVASFEAGLLEAPTVVTRQEHDLQTLVAWRRAGRPWTRHPLARTDRVVRDGARALRARTARRLDAWDGVVGALPGLAPDPQVALSATSLEHWAHCPFRYFLARVLRVEDVERPETRDRITPLDRGVIIHEALQDFVLEHPDRRSDEPWTPPERARLRDLVTRACDDAADDGRTGRPLLWRLDRDRIVRHLDAVLDTDEWLRSTHGLRPLAVEVGFGMAGDSIPALTLDLDGVGRVTFRGRIDRVDTDATGGRLEILDYKTGGSDAYEGIDADIVLGGQRLQLALYALAVRNAHPDAAISAHYWFTREQGAEAFRGFALDDDAEARVHDVLATVVGAIAAGLFPAYPGAEGWFGPTNCAWCPYDRLCPRDRVRRFERRRGHPALEPLLSLREPDGALEDPLEVAEAGP
jgi:hypothetical protein